MKLNSYLPLLTLLSIFSISNASAAGSALRVTCSGEDVGAEVTINGKFKGECPLDMEVKAGTYKLRVAKSDATYDYVFEQDIRLGDGVAKKVEAVLSKRLNAAAQRAEDNRLILQAAATQAAIDSIEMVLVPGANYEMGKYEVTEGQWEPVMGSNPSYYQCKKNTQCNDRNLPVTKVSWNDVQKFIQILNSKTGKQYRLPTKSEWQHACYGGVQTIYCGGNDINAIGWYAYILDSEGDHTAGNSGNRPHDIGQKQANNYGLYDMTGNVREWLQDSYINTVYNTTDYLVIGGSYGDSNWVARVVTELTEHESPTSSSEYIGFRLVRSLP